MRRKELQPLLLCDRKLSQKPTKTARRKTYECKRGLTCITRISLHPPRDVYRLLSTRENVELLLRSKCVTYTHEKTTQPRWNFCSSCVARRWYLGGTKATTFAYLSATAAANLCHFAKDRGLNSKLETHDAFQYSPLLLDRFFFGRFAPSMAAGDASTP